MARIVTYGCSHTQGDGLHHVDGSYPAILSRKLGIPCVNHAKSGQCNKQILRSIQQSDLLPDDVVIVQWTYIKRTTIFTDIDIPIRTWILAGESVYSSDNNIFDHNKKYYETFDYTSNQLFENMAMIDLTEYYLRQHAGKVIHLIVDPLLYKHIKHASLSKPEIVMWDWVYPDDTNDGKHPNEKQHKLISQIVLGILDKSDK